MAAGLVAVFAATWIAPARDAAVAPRAGPAPGTLAALSVFRSSARAWALTLFYFLSFGGFFPPLVMGVVKAATGGYAVGFGRMAVVAAICPLVLVALPSPSPSPPLTAPS